MTHDPNMAVGTLRIRLVIRGARSLKDKRRVVKSIKDRVRGRFNASIAEVDHHDVHQSAVLGVAVVAADHAHLQSVLSKIAHLAATARDAEMIACDTEIL